MTDKKEKNNKANTPSFMEAPLRFDPLNVTESWAAYVEQAANNPEEFWNGQIKYWSDYLELVQRTQKKLMGDENVEDLITTDPGDRRFKAEEWNNNAYFDFIKQAYLMTSNWMEDQVKSTKGLDQRQKEKLLFTTRLLSSALSPTNFALTNPLVIKETLETKGANLIKGLENLKEDLKRGGGELKITTTPHDAFTVGDDIACTKGDVIYQNELMQLIHYTPAGDKTYETPMLIVPPWINKYYILDLKPENSLVKWALDQGHSVFMISWVNPDASLAHIDFEDYISKGFIQALDIIEKNTSQKTVNAIGYCLGGTMLSCALSYLKTQNQSARVSSATFLTTLIDFEHAGDLKLFLSDDQIDALEMMMRQEGVFSAKQLQQTFALLRANDLIWSFVVNNYLMGKEPFPFDLLYWNDDSTNIPAAMQSFYLRNMYRDNIAKDPGGITLLGQKIDISTIDIPCYFLSTREDHIAPWVATYEGAKIISRKNKNVSFTLAASGHIAGVVNPPTKNKYCYWTNSKIPDIAEDWLENAAQNEGSWWPHWNNWLIKFAGKKTTAPKAKKSIEKAPGSYVKKRA